MEERARLGETAAWFSRGGAAVRSAGCSPSLAVTKYCHDHRPTLTTAVVVVAAATIPNSFEARGSRLLVLRGTPEEVLPRIFKDWSIAKICFEVDTEPYALARDARVRELAAASRVEVFSPVSHTLYVSEEEEEEEEGGRRKGRSAAVSHVWECTRMV